MRTNEVKALLQGNRKPISIETKSIQYAPAGSNTIYPSVDGKPAKVTLSINEPLAQKLDAQLQAWLSEAESGLLSRPYVDFDHDGKTAAAIPKRFFWEDGLRLEIEWTQAGKDAVEGKNYSYFSPEILIDKKTKEVIGLPPFGAIGTLTNAPAFQTIERLAAASSKHQLNPDNMEKEIQEKLIAAEAKLATREEKIATLQASLESVEKERDEVIEERDSLVTERDELKETNATLQASADEVREEKIAAQIEAKGIKDEKGAILKACLSSEDDGGRIARQFGSSQVKGPSAFR